MCTTATNALGELSKPDTDHVEDQLKKCYKECLEDDLKHRTAATALRKIVGKHVLGPRLVFPELPRLPDDDELVTMTKRREREYKEHETRCFEMLELVQATQDYR